MFRFFRQIRHKLLVENRVSRYLLYAIGEIILVVIGILLALQVNNWNEDHRRLEQERTLLSGLLEDLNSASAQSQGFIEEEKDLVEDLLLVLGISPKASEVADSLYTDRKMGSILWDFESDIPVINSYAEIKNTGRTVLISNRNIRERFTNLELSLSMLNNLVKDRLTVQQLRIDDIAANRINFVRYVKYNDESLGVDLSKETENDYRTLVKDPTVRNLLAIKLILTQDVLNFRNNLHNDIEAIMDLIRNELENP